MIRELRMWHLMFVGGILGGLIGGVHEALAYVDHASAFVIGMFLGGFVGWGIVSAVLVIFRVVAGHPATHQEQGHPAQPR